MFCCLMSQIPHVNHQSGANESLVSQCWFRFIENKVIFMHINILNVCFVLFPEGKMTEETLVTSPDHRG